MFFLIGKGNQPSSKWVRVKHVDEVFIEKLLFAHEVLPEDEFFDLTNKITNGLLKALETYGSMDAFTFFYMPTWRSSWS